MSESITRSIWKKRRLAFSMCMFLVMMGNIAVHAALDSHGHRHSNEPLPEAFETAHHHSDHSHDGEIFEHENGGDHEEEPAGQEESTHHDTLASSISLEFPVCWVSETSPPISFGDGRSRPLLPPYDPPKTV